MLNLLHLRRCRDDMSVAVLVVVNRPARRSGTCPILPDMNADFLRKVHDLLVAMSGPRTGALVQERLRIFVRQLALTFLKVVVTRHVLSLLTGVDLRSPLLTRCTMVVIATACSGTRKRQAACEQSNELLVHPFSVSFNLAADAGDEHRCTSD